MISTRMTITRNGRPRARFAAQIARYSNTPVRFSTATISIMPSSRKMTFQSMPASSEKNACSASVAPMQQHQHRAAEGGRDPVHPLGGDQDVGAGEDGHRQPGGDAHEASTRSSSASRVTAPRIVPSAVDDRDQRAARAGHQRGDLQHGRARVDHRQLPALPRQHLGHRPVAQLPHEHIGGGLVDHPGQRRVVLAVLRHGQPQHLSARQNRQRATPLVHHDQPGQVLRRPAAGRPRSPESPGSPSGTVRPDHQHASQASSHAPNPNPDADQTSRHT